MRKSDMTRVVTAKAPTTSSFNQSALFKYSFLLIGTLSMSVVNPSNSLVVVVGLNGALQKRFVLKEGGTLVPGNVHRAQQMETGVGGKGQDVAIALSCLAATNPPDDDDSSSRQTATLVQFVGQGPEGDLVMDLLQQRRAGVYPSGTGGGNDGTATATVRCKTPLRTCTTIVASDVSTELVEPSGDILQEEMEELFAKIKDNIQVNWKEAQAPVLCIMGSMPPGCPADTYAQLYERTIKSSSGDGDGTGKTTNTPLVLIDSVVGLDPLLDCMQKKSLDSTNKGCAVLKINASELCKLAKVGANREEASGVSLELLSVAIQGFVESHGSAAAALDYMAITDGKHPAHLVAFDKEQKKETPVAFDLYKIQVPTLDSQKQVLYPIGAGDTVAGGTLAAWQSLQLKDKTDGGGSGVLEVESIQKALQEKVAAATSVSAIPPQVSTMATAFAFGLACGSASCLKQQNSVFDPMEALGLFQKLGDMEKVSSTT